MKKGSKACKCILCNKIVGYKVPTGKFHHGLEEVEFKMKPGCVWAVKCFRQMYYCKDCKPQEVES